MDLDSLARARLEWMFDNEPELVRDLLRSNQLDKLEEILESRLVQAVRYAQTLEKSGRNHQEAIEIASELILTPADGPAFSDHPPKPLAQKLRQEVYRKLDERAAAEERRERARARRQNRT
jgi:hypothetical protein